MLVEKPYQRPLLGQIVVEKPCQLPTTGPNTAMPYIPKPGKSSESFSIALVESIIIENTSLKNQIQHLQAQMDKARSLSNGLLSENKCLRQVYQQRNKDISKLIKSISVQNEENRTDIQHQSHLIQQLNFSTLKEIKVLDKQRRETDERTSDKKKAILQLATLKNELQNEELIKIRARIQNGISERSAQTKKQQYENSLETNRNLEKDINQLIVSSSKVNNEITYLLKTGHPQRDMVTLQKEQIQQKLQIIKEENRRYRQELSADKLQLEKTEEEKRTKEEIHKKILKNLNDEIQKYEFNQRCLNQIANDRDKAKSRIGLSFTNQSKLSNSLETIKDEKLQLLKSIRLKKARLIEGGQEFKKREEALRQGSRQNILRMMNQISKNEASFEEQKKQLLQEKKKVEDQINILEHEDSSLDDQIEEYSKLVNSHVNPIREIEKIQLSMRIKTIR